MIGDYYLSAKSIGLSTCNGRKPQSLEVAAKHNKRELGAPSKGLASGLSTEEWSSQVGAIDWARTGGNYALGGASDAAGVVAMAKQLEHKVNYRPKRKDYTQAVEVVFSLPVACTIDRRQYFADCVAWCGGKFGAGSILSADVHLDQAVPHCHVLIAPIQAGEWAGSKVLEQDAYQALRESFQADVAEAYGLRMPERLKGPRKAAAVSAVLSGIAAKHSYIMARELWEPIRKAIERDPAEFLEVLGLELPSVPSKKMKTMEKIFTGKGKGPKCEEQPNKRRLSNPIGIQPSPEQANPIGIDRTESTTEKARPNPIGIAKQANPGGAKVQSLSCVGIELSGCTLATGKQGNDSKGSPRVEHVLKAPRADFYDTAAGAVVQVITGDDGTTRERYASPFDGRD